MEANEEICWVFNDMVAEDLYHFLMECPAFTDLKRQFFFLTVICGFIPGAYERDWRLLVYYCTYAVLWV